MLAWSKPDSGVAAPGGDLQSRWLSACWPLARRSAGDGSLRGRVLSERSARRLFGTSSVPKLAALGLKVETVPRRFRYVLARPTAASARICP
jgi:hypothetical protein